MGQHEAREPAQQGGVAADIGGEPPEQSTVHGIQRPRDAGEVLSRGVGRKGTKSRPAVELVDRHLGQQRDRHRTQVEHRQASQKEDQRADTGVGGNGTVHS